VSSKKQRKKQRDIGSWEIDWLAEDKVIFEDNFSGFSVVGF
jgi:hypothetical protein